MMLFAEEEALGQTMSRTEMPFSGILATDDDRQRNAQMLSLIGCDVPLVGVGEVLEDDLRDVQLIATPLSSASAGIGSRATIIRRIIDFNCFIIL